MAINFESRGSDGHAQVGVGGEPVDDSATLTVNSLTSNGNTANIVIAYVKKHVGVVGSISAPVGSGGLSGIPFTSLGSGVYYAKASSGFSGGTVSALAGGFFNTTTVAFTLHVVVFSGAAQAAPSISSATIANGGVMKIAFNRTLPNGAPGSMMVSFGSTTSAIATTAQAALGQVETTIGSATPNHTAFDCYTATRNTVTGLVDLGVTETAATGGSVVAVEVADYVATAPGAVIINKAGNYRVKLSFSGTQNATYTFTFSVYKNGSVLSGGDRLQIAVPTGSADNVSYSAETVLALAQNDYLNVYGKASGAAGLVLLSSDIVRLLVERVS